mmetsp:Transcript_143207/g.399196  ORF Transcript_143207/g.399196 Transcript_143207/m.399196 type:complete len:546 (-) Transcript_143207:228-1865(-)
MEAMPAPIESLPEAEPEAGPAPVDLANASAAPDDLGGKDLAHAARFEKYTGMSPQRCFRYVLLSLGLRQMATCWYGMIALEYMRYYITNDLGRADVLKTATTSPLFAVQAFLFPFWGVVADRVSRKRVLVAACFASVVSSWMITFIPSITTFVLANVTNLVGDLAGPIRDAILRDLCTVEEWETSRGGATGIKARMFVIGHAAFLVAAAIGMVLLKLGENGIGLPNEYQVHKAECSEMFCLHPGQYSWNSFWEVDGSLRLLMMMGAIATTLDFCVATLLLPETLRPEHRCGTILKFVQSNWREFVRPWNNLRVIATPQLQYLMFVRFLVYVVFAGWNSICLCFYQRFAFDTFTMTLHTLAAGLTTWLVTMAVPLLVVRFGDLRGVWIPQIVLMTVFVISAALLPPGHGYMAFVLYLLLAGPALGFGSMAPELLPKLVPSNIQGTYQTARYFIFRLSQAVFAWPWNQLFLHTRHLGYPVDGILLWLAILIFLIVLWLTIRILPQDPRAAILQGRALEAFWDTPYVRGEWYRYHSGAIVGKARQAEV